MRKRLLVIGYGVLLLCGSAVAQVPAGFWTMQKRVASGDGFETQTVAPGVSKFFGTDGSGNLVLSTVPAALTDGDKGSITVSGTGSIWTINNGAVSNAMLANGGITINGVSIALGGSVSNLQTSNGTLALGGFGGITGTLAVANGGTGQTAYTDGQLLIGNTATGLLSKASLTAGSNVTITNGNGTITIAASGGGGGSSAALKTDVGFHQNSGSGATDLASFSVPANTLANVGDSIEFDVWGSFGASSSNKYVQVVFGASVLVESGTAASYQTMGWRAHGRITMVATTLQTCTAEFTAGLVQSGGVSGATAVMTTAPSANTTGAITFKVVGQGPSTGEVIQNGMVLKYVPKEP